MSLGSFGLDFLTQLYPDPTVGIMFFLIMAVAMLFYARASFNAAALTLLAFLWAIGYPLIGGSHGTGWGTPFDWFFWAILAIYAVAAGFKLWAVMGESQ
jgi:hypothetical protein